MDQWDLIQASKSIPSGRPRPVGSKSSTPSRRRPSSPDQNAESSEETDPALQLTSSSKSELPEDTPMTTLPITPLRKRPVNGLAVGGSGSTPASPMERMKTLEIERLKGELDEKDTEISRLEKLVGDGNKVIAGHVQRVSWPSCRLVRIFGTTLTKRLLPFFLSDIVHRERGPRDSFVAGRT